MDDDELEDRDEDGLAASDDDESAPNDLDLAEAQEESSDETACRWLPTAAPVRSGRSFRVYTLLPKTTFSWDNVAASGRLTYELGLPLDLVSTPELVLVVRVHAASITTARATFVLEATSRSNDEPETAYASATPLATVVIDQSADAGSSHVARARSDLAPFVRARLHLDQPASPRGASMTLSADLVARAQAPGECRCPTDR